MEHISTTQPVYLDGMPGSDNIVHKPNEKSEPLHEYVEIGGLKWATMNVGATSETDAGLYFQWGDVLGYTADLVGSGEGQKYFGWADYKYGDGSSDIKYPRQMSKYCSFYDDLTVLTSEDDAVTANWGGSWRMPTTEELQTLREAVNVTWVSNYNGSGVSGLKCVDKTDDSKVLFFPSCGAAMNGKVTNLDEAVFYTSSCGVGSNYFHSAYRFKSDRTYIAWNKMTTRYIGYPVRGVMN